MNIQLQEGFKLQELIVAIIYIIIFYILVCGICVTNEQFAQQSK